MKVFISWSGERSKALAIVLKGWLPLILQYTIPWVSEKDISAGDRWALAIAGELEASNFGIICITPENRNSEWILFEAGALSKSMLDAKVVPLLFGLELSDLSGPLSQFQALKMDQQGFMDLVKAINAMAETKATETTIDHLVPTLWPQIKQKLDTIPDKAPSAKQVRPQIEILEELVSQVRGLGARMRDFDLERIERDAITSNIKYRELDYALDEMMHMEMSGRDGEISLLIMAGYIHDRAPWLAEILLEAHRELRNAGPEETREIGFRLLRMVKKITRGPLADRLLGQNKSGHILMMELPRYLERTISMRIDAIKSTDNNLPEESDYKG